MRRKDSLVVLRKRVLSKIGYKRRNLKKEETSKAQLMMVFDVKRLKGVAREEFRFLPCFRYVPANLLNHMVSPNDDVPEHSDKRCIVCFDQRNDSENRSCHGSVLSDFVQNLIQVVVCCFSCTKSVVRAEVVIRGDDPFTQEEVLLC